MGSTRAKVWAWLKNFILPPRCLECGVEVHEAHALCALCWPKYTFINPPLCTLCGRPFSLEMDLPTLCSSCLNHKEPFRQLRAAIFYEEMSKGIILRFKHQDALHLSKPFAHWLAQAYTHFDQTHDVMIPVPLHWTRLFKRRYNQAALLSQDLSRLIKVPTLLNGLKRVKRTPSQGVFSASGRKHNVKNAFVVHPDSLNAIKNRRIVLVDDVFTTGATVRACAEVLLDAGALNVDVLALARVQLKERP